MTNQVQCIAAYQSASKLQTRVSHNNEYVEFIDTSTAICFYKTPNMAIIYHCWNNIIEKHFQKLLLLIFTLLVKFREKFEYNVIVCSIYSVGDYIYTH